MISPAEQGGPFVSTPLQQRHLSLDSSTPDDGPSVVSNNKSTGRRRVAQGKAPSAGTPSATTGRSMGPSSVSTRPLRCAAPPSRVSTMMLIAPGCTVRSDASWARASRPGAPPCQREVDGVLALRPKLSTGGRLDTTVPRLVSPLHYYCGRRPCGWSHALLFRALGRRSSLQASTLPILPWS
ncbi:hypothetical protein VTN02DRAFT_3173 [Thermoascus thermophilus]